MRPLNRLGNQKDLLLALFIFICGFALYFATSLPVGVILGGSDEADIVAPAMVAEERGTILYREELNSEYSTYWFRMPGYYSNPDGEMYPRGFIGVPLIFTPLYFMLGNIAINVFNSFFGAIAAVFLFLICKDILRSRAIALTVSLVFVFSAFVWLQSVYLFPELVGLATLLMSVYFLIKSRRGQDRRYLVLAGLIMSVAVLCRLFNILLIIPAILYLFYGKNWKGACVLGAVVCLSIIPQLIFNQQTNGNLFAFSYFTGDYDPYGIPSPHDPFQYAEDANSGNVVSYFVSQFLIPKDGGTWYWFHIRTMPALLFKLSPLFILLPIGIVYAIRQNKGLVFLILLTLLLYFYIFGNMDYYYGMNELAVRSSYVRYMLLPLTALLVISGSALDLLRRVTSRIPLLLSVFLMAIIVATPLATTRQSETHYYLYMYDECYKHSWMQTRSSILSQTESNAVIFCTIDETSLAGERQLFYYINIPEPTYSEEIESVATELLNNGVPVYVYRVKEYSKWDPVTPRGGQVHDFSSDRVEVTEMSLPSPIYELLKLSLR